MNPNCMACRQATAVEGCVRHAAAVAAANPPQAALDGDDRVIRRRIAHLNKIAAEQLGEVLARHPTCEPYGCGCGGRLSDVAAELLLNQFFALRASEARLTAELDEERQKVERLRRVAQYAQHWDCNSEEGLTYDDAGKPHLPLNCKCGLRGAMAEATQPLTAVAYEETP